MWNEVFPPVGVADMAERREARMRRQNELVIRYGMPLVCFTMNIAGPIKNSRLICFAFRLGLDLIRSSLGNAIEHIEEVCEKTGCEAFIAARLPAAVLKERMLDIENSAEIGRWYDIDVIDTDGNKLSREEPRRCIICGKMAAVCARSRAHSVQELWEATMHAFSESLAAYLGQCAVSALYDEVHLTPKPGLVDELNSGANSDMDIGRFEASAKAIKPFFIRMAAESIGYSPDYINAEMLVPILQRIGIEAERAMLSATGGVNTHRGAIYSLGLLVSACASFAVNSGEGEAGFAETITNRAAKLAAFQRIDPCEQSNGARMRCMYGVGGVRAQAIGGFPLAKRALARYNEAKNADCSVNPWCIALMEVMAILDDTNALKRGGRDGLRFVRRRASELMQLGTNLSASELMSFDSELIELNISCGGAADTIAAAMLLDKFERIFYH